MNIIVVSKNLLGKETVSIGIQMLHLKPLSVALLNEKDTDWVWVHGLEVCNVVPSKFIMQINPKIVEVGGMIGKGIDENGEGDTLKGAVGYGFCSNGLQELAGVMFRMLSPDNRCRMVEVKQTDKFPYQINGGFTGQMLYKQMGHGQLSC